MYYCGANKVQKMLYPLQEYSSYFTQYFKKWKYIYITHQQRGNITHIHAVVLNMWHDESQLCSTHVCVILLVFTAFFSNVFCRAQADPKLNNFFNNVFLCVKGLQLHEYTHRGV